MFPPESEPPMMAMPRIIAEISGSARKTVAMLVSGPRATMVISPGFSRTMREIISLADSRDGFVAGAGNSTPAIPLFPGAGLAGTRRPGEGGVPARGPGNSRAAGGFDETQRIWQGEFERHVATDRCDGLDFQFR